MKKYICTICGYIYEEAKGMPEKGITPGTKWEDLPEGWVCPWCGAAKSAFREEAEKEVRQPEQAAAEPVQQEEEDDLRELSIGELSALCSNLARGCEKQYLSEEAGLFTQLSDYLKSKIPERGESAAEDLLALVQNDVDKGFPNAVSASKADSDRGALRALVWGEKVTRMLHSILNRYIKEGGDFLEHTNVYVCDICGFIYVGDTPPEICPVCKVPNWKMSRVERG